MSLLDEPAPDPARVREVLARATADLAPAERARVVELMAQRVRARNRGRRYPRPVDLAHVLDDTTVQTPMLELLDGELARVADGSSRRVAIFTPPQEGKALALDTPVPTPAGWTTMGALQVGDAVLDGAGSPCRVTWVSPTWTGRDCYAVTTGDGERIVADAAHEWVAQLTAAGPRRVYETTNLARTRSKNARITGPAPLALPDANLPLDPYLLGAWLGDGSSTAAAITCHPDDNAILDRIRAAGTPVRKLAAPFRWSLADAGTGRARTSAIRRALVALGVWGNKHVPTAYLRSSPGQRLALLQGLVDTDGHVTAKGQVEFRSTTLLLAEGVRELVYSLGAKAVLTTGRATINGKDCGPKYRVRFYLANAAHLPRKAARCKDSSVARIRYVSAAPTESLPTRCIEVDSPDHMFLAGRTMLPTHNSTRVTEAGPLWMLLRNPDLRIGIASYELNVATRFGQRIRDEINARGMGTRRDPNPPEVDVLSLGIREDYSAASRWRLADHRGGITSVGIGGALTGRPIDGLFIDDPVKDSVQAESIVYRERVWSWWTAVAQTRLPRDGFVVLIMCMTGDTPVLMADRTERPLRDVRPGDLVATLDGERVGSARVARWVNQGPDQTYSIRMESGVVVRANARHPFLTDEDGVRTWRRLRDLTVGTAIVRVTRPGEASPGSPAPAGNPPAARACACAATTAPAGPPDTVPPPPKRSRAAPSASGAATASPPTSTTASSPHRVVAAPSAAADPRTHLDPPTGPRCSPSTTTTTPGSCAACSATTATSSSPTPEPPISSSPPLAISATGLDRIAAITPDAVEDVYDVQIDRTENFIAAGLVAHNTRWHEDDLGGRLIEQERMLPAHQRTWRFVSVPAVAEPQDPQGKRLPDALGRAPGVYLQSARGRTPADFEATRLGVGERVWSALYQQNPTPSTGGIFTWASITRNRRPAADLEGRDLLPSIIDSLTVRRVAVDPPGGSGTRDEAGIVGGGRAGDRIYVTHDRSGKLNATQWPRRALLLAFELAADTIVWEQNLAPGTTRTVIAQAWVRLQRQARVLVRHLERLDEARLEEALNAAALELTAAEAGLAPELVDDTTVHRAELLELLPWRTAIATYVDSGPRLKPVTASQGKRIRATPVSIAYEQNRVSHVGVFPELETQLTTWIEGESSPDRMDADVWLITELLPPPRRSRRDAPPATTIATGADTFRRT